MKNKKITYLLLIVSIVLWGFIGWKVYSTFNFTQPEIPIAKKETLIIEKDSISLLLNYRDPFLGKYNSSIIVKDTILANKKQIAVSSLQKTEPIAPQVQFKGVMSVGKVLMAILKKDSRVVSIKIGEEIDGYKLIKMDDNKIILSKGRNKYEIPIK